MTVTQGQFIAAVLSPDAAVPAGLLDPEGAPTLKRFNVYRNNVAVSLTEALGSAFPVLAKLIGPENFRKLAGLYLRAHPPSSPLMMAYGDQMAAFLEGFPPLQHLPYLSDIARMEQALRRSYHAADAVPVASDVLHALSPDELMATRFELAPAMEVIRSNWPLYGIWAYNAKDGAPKPAPVAQSVLITRLEFDPQPVAISHAAAELIVALQAGQPLGAAVDAASAATPDFELSQPLGALIQGGAITKVIL